MNGLYYKHQFQKHPHLHGEDDFAFSASDFGIETPPPTWGRRSMYQRGKLCFRNTPTYMGKTGEQFRLFQKDEKHPHLHGEDAKLVFVGDRKQETPPPTWGRPCKDPVIRCQRRNTPTYMGKTGYRTRCKGCFWKHPHLHGEDTKVLCLQEPSTHYVAAML